MADLTLSLDSRIDVDGKPTRSKVGLKTVLDINMFQRVLVGSIGDMTQPEETFDVIIAEVDKEKQNLEVSVKLTGFSRADRTGQSTGKV